MSKARGITVSAATTASSVRPWNGNSASALPPRGLTVLARHRPYAYRAQVVDVWLLGIATTLGGQFFGWNKVLQAGIVPATTAFGLVAVAYIIQGFSSAEILSAVPFPGGEFALSRSLLGFYPGFLVGAIVVLEYLVYVAISAVVIADMLVASYPSIRGVEPMLWFLVLGSAIFLQGRRDRFFWRLTGLFALVSMAILVLFCLGSLEHCDFSLTVPFMDVETQQEIDRPSLLLIMRVLPYSSWLFVGIEAVGMAAPHVASPTLILPQAQRWAILVVFVGGLAVFIVTAGLPPGIRIMARALAPFNVGFTSFLGLDDAAAMFLSLPATYAGLFGFMWGYGQLVTALALARILPRPLNERITLALQNPHRTSVSIMPAVVVGTIPAFGLCGILHYAPRIKSAALAACMALALLANMSQCLCFIMLRLHFHTIVSSTSYRSPFGVIGAALALIIWLGGVLGLLVFGHGDGGLEIAGGLAAYLLVLTLYYHFYARHHETVSQAEQEIVALALQGGGGGGGAGRRRSTIQQVMSSAAIHPEERTQRPGGVPSEEARTESFTKDTSIAPAEPSPGSPTSPGASFPMIAENGTAPGFAMGPTMQLGSLRAAGPPVLIGGGGGFGRSFLRRGRLERLREETERDLRSALSGIWPSERSHRFSIGRRS